ncbi:Gamma-glutamyltransferase, partial [Pseudomonas savastanoi]
MMAARTSRRSLRGIARKPRRHPYRESVGRSFVSGFYIRKTWQNRLLWTSSDQRRDARYASTRSAASSPGGWRSTHQTSLTQKKKRSTMKFEPLARSLIATALIVAYSPSFAASQAPVAAENGMVVTAQHLATHVGVDVLKAGGNAVDAAVAVGYALAVVYPA